MRNKLKNLSVPDISLLGILAFMPLVMTYGYFNITITKMVFFSAMSIFAFVYSLIKMNTDSARLYNEKITSSDVSMGLFLFSAFISVLMSDYRIEAILGNQGRFMGMIYVIALFCAYVFITRFTVFKKQFVITFVVCFTVVCLISIVQYIGFDVFYLLREVKENTRVNYISTIGNINVFSSFVCLGLPIAMYLFCFHRKKTERVCYFLVSVLGFYSLVISNTDSGYLGIIGAFVILGTLSAKIKNSLSRLFLLVPTFIFTIKLAVMIDSLLPAEARELSDIAVHAAESTAVMIGALVLIVIAVVLRLVNLEIRHSTPMKIFFIAIPLICGFALAGAIVWFSFFDTKTNLGAFSNYLRFGELWGSERGHVWRITAEAYKELPFIKKLFGCGPDTLLPLLMKKHEQQMLQTGSLTDNAHNEFLQYLVTHGIVGLGCYIATVFFSLKKCFYKSPYDFYRKSLAVAVFAYCVQSFFNISQPITTPIYFSLMFMTFTADRDVLNKQKKTKGEEYEKVS